MLVLKLIQSLIKTLHSEGTPGQVAAGLALGAILGLTPLWNLHNAAVLASIIVLNVSFPGAMLGWALFVPVGFLLDPAFDWIGRTLLLDTSALWPVWTAFYNTPVVPLTNFNNTVVLGSLVFASVAWLPLFFASRWGVVRYRTTVAERVKQSPDVRIATFRWKAVVPLLLLGVAGLGFWLAFGDRIATRTTESVGTTLVGAEVEIERVHLDLSHGRVEIHGLTVASPFEALQNLLQADALVADIDPLPLLEKKVVIDRLTATGLKFGTPRATDGRRATGPDGLMDQVNRWGDQLRVPALQLATGKVEMGRLDVARLNTPRAAAALAARTDSARRAWDSGLGGLDGAAIADSARRMVERLRGANATDVKLLGEARRSLEQLKQAQDRATALERSVTSGIAALQADATGLREAKQRDYATARALLKLPGLDAPDIGAALFGAAAVDRFQRALYWVELGRRYMPPGLLPRATPGPNRVRRAGATVRFPRAHEQPAFLLKTAELSVELGTAGAALRTYAASLSGVTSDPALYGRPATASAAAPGFRLGALLDHVRPTPRDTAAASLAGVALPALPLPSLPIRLEPGVGTVALSFSAQGDQVRARWTVQSDRVRWTRDSAGPSSIGDLVWRVVSGIPTLEVSASLTGSLARPEIAVSSNLDRALAERVRAVAGAEVAAADARVRAQVDSLVDRHVAPAVAQVTTLVGDATRRLGGQRAQLDDARKALEQRLRELTRLPGVRLP